MTTSRVNFYHDEPLFGLDIGSSSLKVMQISNQHSKPPKVIGYGVSSFYPTNVADQGIIVKPDILSQSLYEVLKKNLKGSITTKRVACTIPTAHTFSRLVQLPVMEDADLAEAVHLEVEQYIPVPAAQLSVAYEVFKRTPTGIEILMMATPKNIINSYVKFLESVNLEPVALEPSMNASARLFSMFDAYAHQPSILVDFGSAAIDVAIIDQTVFVNTTIPGGSDTLADQIAEKLRISRPEAMDIKNQFGISHSDKQQEVMIVAQPMLEALVNEVKKIFRYYNERTAKNHPALSQLVLIGGGSTMPGLSEYLSAALNMQPRIFDPWHKLDFSGLQPLSTLEKSLYITVAGEAILKPKEIFA